MFARRRMTHQGLVGLIVPESRAEGVIVAMADCIGVYGVWIEGDGVLQHPYSLLGVKNFRQAATKPLPSGDVKVKLLFDAEKNTPVPAARSRSS